MWLILLLCIIASFADMIGGSLTVIKPYNQNQLHIITGLGIGFLLGATILDRLPDAMHELPETASLFIMIGYLSLFILDHFSLHFHGASTVTESTLPSGHQNAKTLFVSSNAVLVTFIALLFHTFMDGVIIAGAYTMDASIGFLIFLAIALHKIPEGFSMAMISLASGHSRKRAFLTSVGLATTTMLGALVTLQFKELDAGLIKILMAFATGTFLFISTSGLVPVIKDHQKGAMVSVLIGVTFFYISLLLVKSTNGF